MPERSNREAVEGFWAALERGDEEAATAFMAEGYVEEWPQSRERIRGASDWLRMTKEHPTLPTVRPRRILGAGDVWVAEAEFVYGPDSPAWQVVAVHECRDGRIARITEVFGEPFEPPAWRDGISERY